MTIQKCENLFHFMIKVIFLSIPKVILYTKSKSYLGYCEHLIRKNQFALFKSLICVNTHI